MSSADKRAAIIKRDRRRLIAALGMCYPGSVPGEELYRILIDGNPEYSRTLLVRDATYLCEKGYLTFRGSEGIEQKNISVALCEFRLTADGKDVADKIVIDPTLEL